MGSEVLIYGYGLVCLSMLAFNLIYSLYLRGAGRRTRRRKEHMAAVVVPALSGSRVPEGHTERMADMLRQVKDLLALDDYLQTLPEEIAGEYITRIAGIFPGLAKYYDGRDDMFCAYFSYFVQRWGRYMTVERRKLAQTISLYANKNSLYCRINALKALCTLGDAEVLLDALVYLAAENEEDFPINDKIVVELLLKFEGDSREFIELIWDRFERFPPLHQRALLDYIRFKSGDYSNKMLDILTDTGRDKELRLSAIRYFTRYPDERARTSLLGFVSDKDPANWEYAAIAASALAEYPGEDSVDVLSEAMHSSNWYVRSNSAESLEKLGFRYEDLLGKAAAEDRYAREMLTYRLETRMLNAERDKAKEAAKA